MDKHRRCAKCAKDLLEEEFIPTKSKFMPGGRSIICSRCLTTLVDASDLAQVDKLMQWLDYPFLIDQWTRIHKSAGRDTLLYYIKLIEGSDSYRNMDWSETNKLWFELRESGQLDERIEGASEKWLREMARKWPSEIERTVEDYHYLDDFYNDLISTQNIVTATQRDDAKRLCEVALLVNKKIRAGLPAKDEMAMYHNIIKAEAFEPKNAKNLGDFNSVGELFTWLEKKGWNPKWHTEPQDSVDFTMKQLQTFTRRLVENEGSISEQVADRRRQLELASRIESEDANFQKVEGEEILKEIEYDDSAAFESDFLEDDEDALN